MTDNTDITPAWPMRSGEADAPWSAADAAAMPQRNPSSYLVGMEGTPREVGYGENSWLSSLVLVMLIIIAFNFNNCRRLFKNFPQDLVGLRHHDNAFDSHTSSEARTSVLIILLLCVSEGILLFTAADLGGLIADGTNPFAAAMALSGIALGYFAFQYVVYGIIGYTFVDRYMAAQWLRGFVASQLLLSFLLLAPALVSLYWASSAEMMLTVFAILYATARLLFICKGFRIFYNNFLSLLYFILYLCALEITPLLILRKIVVNLF